MTIFQDKLKSGLFKGFIGFFITILVIPFYLITVNATLQDDLVAVQKRLQEIRNQKSTIQNNINNEKATSSQYSAQIAALKNQTDLLDAQVQEKELVIQELDIQINLLTENIKLTEEEISKAESNINQLENETDKRMVDIYINEKTSTQMNVFFSAQNTDFIKYSVYQNSVQQETNNLVADLNSQKTAFEAKKKELEENRIQIVESQTQLNEEKLTLVKSQSEYEQKKAQFIRLRNAALNKVNEYSSYYKYMSSEEKKS